MSRLLLMSDLVLRCQRRADMEGDDVITPPEWKALISEQYTSLYSTVVSAGMRYFEATDSITATGATSYPLPVDHDETIGVDRVIDAATDQRVQLEEMMIQERTAWSGQTGEARAYSIVGQTVVLFPRPSTGTYKHVYVPQAPDLSALADSATVDLVTGDGESFLIWGVAVVAVPKRDRDPTLAITQRDGAGKRFAKDVQRRALVNPRRRVPRGGSAGGAGGCYDSEAAWLANDPGDWSWRWR
jgi:hypothetical protein